jgi:hypothetical protein
MGVTSGVSAGRVLRDESLKTIPGETPKKSSVADTPLAIQRQLHAIGVWDNIAVIARAAVTRVFAEFGVCFEIIGAAVVPIFELVGIVE